MNSQLKISGDALLVFAALVTILGKIIPSQFEGWGKSLTQSLSKRALAPGQVVRYSLLLALGAVVLSVIFIYTVGNSEDLIWAGVLSTLFVISLVGLIYLRSLQFTGRILMRWKPRKYLAFRATITASNWLLFFVSLALLASVYAVGLIYSGSSQNALQRVLVVLYILPIGLSGFSLLFPSFVYLASCQALQLPQRLSKISAKLFWGVVLVIGLIGSVLLLIDDVIQ